MQLDVNYLRARIEAALARVDDMILNDDDPQLRARLAEHRPIVRQYVINTIAIEVLETRLALLERAQIKHLQ